MEMKIGKTTEIEREVTGVSDSGKYSISANVRVSNDNLSGINSGYVRDENGNEVANFSYYGSLSVNFSTDDTDKMKEAFDGINSFVGSCKARLYDLTVSETKAEEE